MEKQFSTVFYLIMSISDITTLIGGRNYQKYHTEGNKKH